MVYYGILRYTIVRYIIVYHYISTLDAVFLSVFLARRSAAGLRQWRRHVGIRPVEGLVFGGFGFRVYWKGILQCFAQCSGVASLNIGIASWLTSSELR